MSRSGDVPPVFIVNTAGTIGLRVSHACMVLPNDACVGITISLVQQCHGSVKVLEAWNVTRHAPILEWKVVQSDHPTISTVTVDIEDNTF